MKVIAIIQMRMGSSRLPGKVLKELLPGVSVLSYLVQRLKKSRHIDEIIIATSSNKENDLIETECTHLGLNCYRGEEDDVLDRYYRAAKKYASVDDYILRITGDCPFIDPVIVDNVVEFSLKHGLDFCNNSMKATFPDGMDVALMTFTALSKAWHDAHLPSEREHVTPFIVKNSSYKGGTIFKSDCFIGESDYSNIRVTLDEKEDFEVLKMIASKLPKNASCNEIINFLKSHPEIENINKHLKRNEGIKKSLEMDSMYDR